MSRRWPGWDGALLVALDAIAALLWWTRDLDGMGAPVAALVGITLGWLAVTAWSRRSIPQQDWRGAWRGFPAGWQIYLTLLAWGGRRPVQIALIPLVGVYWLFLRGPQRDGIDAYLARRMPDATDAARSRARFRLLLNFAYSLVDRFHLLLHGPDQLVVDRSRVEGLQERLYTGDDDSGVLVLSAHLGNADFASTALNHTRRRVSIVLHRNPTDPYFQLLERSMGEAAPQILPVNTESTFASVSIIRRLREGEIVAMKADRVVDDRVARVQFLGGTIEIPTGPFLVAALSRQPTLILGCFRTGDLVYRMEAVGPRIYAFRDRRSRDEDLQRWAQEFADILASWTEQYPLQWYNFLDPWSDAAAPANDPQPEPVEPTAPQETR